MNIGVAKPSPEQLHLVKHYFIDSHSIHDEVNARVFEEYALQKAGEIFAEKDIAIMVGGTGLYIKAFCAGLDDVPQVPGSVREDIIQHYKTNGKAWLQQQLEINDPVYFAKGEMENPQRMMRALEVVTSTGKSILEFHSGSGVGRPFQIYKIGMELPREQLYHNINSRVDRMMEMGLLDEVRKLVPFKHLNPLQTVGYAELFDFLDGKYSLDEAVEKIKVNTRHYAKRQMTWFKKDAEIHWGDSGYDLI